jgi:hypothetical protein
MMVDPPLDLVVSVLVGQSATKDGTHHELLYLDPTLVKDYRLETLALAPRVSVHLLWDKVLTRWNEFKILLAEVITHTSGDRKTETRSHANDRGRRCNGSSSSCHRDERSCRDASHSDGTTSSRSSNSRSGQTCSHNRCGNYSDCTKHNLGNLECKSIGSELALPRVWCIVYNGQSGRHRCRFLDLVLFVQWCSAVDCNLDYDYSTDHLEFMRSMRPEDRGSVVATFSHWHFENEWVDGIPNQIDMAIRHNAPVKVDKSSQNT